MALYRDTGVVLRVQKLGEADRIVTILTRRHGKIRAVAKGVRRTRSRWGARLEPFNHVDVQCYTGRSLDVVTQAETVDAFGVGLVGDYPRYTAGCAVLETVDRLVAEEGEPALRVYLLLVGAIRALSGRERDPSLVLDAFFLRAMTHAGWAPAINDCARCAAPGPHSAFNVAAGGAVCSQCRPPGSVIPSQETFVLLDALLHGEWAIADAAAPATRRDTSGLVAAHLQWHMERQLRSLPLVERRATTPREGRAPAPAVIQQAACNGGSDRP
jgi:DNA repair protein RecO (recombination protein O)